MRSSKSCMQCCNKILMKGDGILVYHLYDFSIQSFYKVNVKISPFVGEIDHTVNTNQPNTLCFD